jgi:uncharacterized protein
MQLLKQVLILLVVIYVALCVALAVLQEKLIFPLAGAALQHERDIVLLKRSDLGKLGGQLAFSVKNADKPVALLLFPGNGEDPTWSADWYAQSFPEFAIYALHYRGHGKSDGPIDVDGIHLDALQMYAHAKTKHKEMIVLGRSLGTGPATRLARAIQADGLVKRLALVTPYDSIANVAQRRFKIFPVALLLRHNFEPINDAPSIKVPTVLVGKTQDWTIPISHAKALHQAFATNVAQFIEMPGDHNDIGLRELTPLLQAHSN